MVEREEDCDDQRGGLAEPANMAGEVPPEVQLFCDGACKAEEQQSKEQDFSTTARALRNETLPYSFLLAQRIMSIPRGKRSAVAHR